MPKRTALDVPERAEAPKILQETAAVSASDESLDRLEGLVRRLENSGLSEYVNLSLNIKRVLMLNFLSGVVRGLGFTVGTTIILAVVYKMMSDIISMNIPYITEMLRSFIDMVNNVR